jgi:hypothetical protein
MVQEPPGKAWLVEPEDLRDDFASGKDNRLRRILPRFARWLFSPPFFPPILIWPLLTIILTDIGSDLLRQKPTYWLDSSISYTRTTLGFPLSWGLLASLLVFAGYILLLALTLVLVNRKLAFTVWVLLQLYHFYYIAHDFTCRTIPSFTFINPGNCSQAQAGIIVLTAIAFALNLAAVFALGLIPLNQEQPAREVKPAPRLPVFVAYATLAWAMILGSMLTIAAFPAKLDWRKIETAHAPSPRMNAALAYDTARNQAILFGGVSEWTFQTGWNNLGDTWEWEGNDWVELFPSNAPPPRRDAGLAYDEARGVMVLFGGVRQIDGAQQEFFNDTWEWNGQNWVEHAPGLSPTGRGSVNIYYDPLVQKVVFHGGYAVDENGNNIFPDDAWEWDGEKWEQVFLERSRGSSASAIIFDPLQQAPMLMGGEGLWLLKDNRWFQPSYPQSPRGRWSSGMVFDAVRQQVVLFGGYEGKDWFNETWVFDGLTWSKLVTENQPSVRTGQMLFFDATRNSVILFGGFHDMNFYNDTWELTQP